MTSVANLRNQLNGCHISYLLSLQKREIYFLRRKWCLCLLLQCTFKTPQSLLTKLGKNTISLQDTPVLHHYISNVHCQHGDLRTYDARETLAQLLYPSKVFIGENRSWLNIEYSKYKELLKR